MTIFWFRAFGVEKCFLELLFLWLISMLWKTNWLKLETRWISRWSPRKWYWLRRKLCGFLICPHLGWYPIQCINLPTCINIYVQIFQCPHILWTHLHTGKCIEAHKMHRSIPKSINPTWLYYPLFSNLSAFQDDIHVINIITTRKKNQASIMLTF